LNTQPLNLESNFQLSNPQQSIINENHSLHPEKYQIEIQFEDKELDINIVDKNKQNIKETIPLSNIIRDQLRGYINDGYVNRIQCVLERNIKDKNNAKEEVERIINEICEDISEDIKDGIYDIGKMERWMIYGGKYGLLPMKFMNNDEDIMIYVYCKANKVDKYVERKWNMIEGRIEGKDNMIKNNMMMKLVNGNVIREMVKNYEMYKKRKEYPVCGYDLLSIELNDLYYLLVRDDNVNYNLNMLDPIRTYNIEYYRKKLLQIIYEMMEDIKVDDRDVKILLMKIMKPHELWYSICSGNIVAPKEFSRYKELEELKMEAKNALYKVYGRYNISEIVALEDYNKIEDAIYLSDCGSHNIGEIAKSIGMMIPMGISTYKYFMDNVHQYTHLFDINSPRIMLIQDIKDGRKVVSKNNINDDRKCITYDDLLYLTDQEIYMVFGITEGRVKFSDRPSLISDIVSQFL
ncbi:Hypothetical protein ORPV_965, partial [Orpheovirus IHUMI-LCC2]